MDVTDNIDIHKYHSSIYQDYLHNHHTWTKHIVDIDEDFCEYDMDMPCPTAQGIIITAFYIPNYVEDLTIEIYGSMSYCSYLEISSDNTPLESLLLTARTLPDANCNIQIHETIDLTNYRRAVPYPFIYAPLERIHTSQYIKEDCYMECYPYNGERKIDIPFPYLGYEDSIYPDIDELIDGDNRKLIDIDMKY